MCGRFTLRTPQGVLVEQFRLKSIPPLQLRFNIAPTQQIGVVREREPAQREFAWMQWGLVPRWAKDPKVGSQMINARAETAAEKSAFRDAFRHRRCLIVADGFYEWKKAGKQKQPYHIRMKDGRPFAFAGLWERWGDGDEKLESCAILTTSANELCAAMHDRMPVILGPADYDRWLDASLVDPSELKYMLEPYPADEMAAEPVNPRVNSVANDDAGCIEALVEERRSSGGQQTLF
jgi:putative SOS response-associated peptidase YedK